MAYKYIPKIDPRDYWRDSHSSSITARLLSSIESQARHDAFVRLAENYLNGGEVMRSYSRKWGESVPRHFEREARSRRKEFDGKAWRGLCRGCYVGADGRGQLCDDASLIRHSALSAGAKEYSWFDGSLEEWLDGKPYIKVEIAEAK